MRNWKMNQMTDDSFLKELKEGSKENGLLNVKLLRETYYLSIKAGLSEPLCLECHELIEGFEVRTHRKHKYISILFCSMEHKEQFYDANKPQIIIKKLCKHCGVFFTVEDRGDGFARGPKKYCRVQCREEAANVRLLVARLKQYKNFNSIRKRVTRNMQTFKAGKGIACLECGNLFIGTRGKKYCCDQPCGQTYRRRQKKNGTEDNVKDW